MNFKSLLRALGPGILVAATGVGAGDLATASLTGSSLGVAVLWAVVLGAFLKFVVNEGLTRWQLATGTTLLEGCVERLGRPLCWLLLAYLVVWSFFVAAALMGAVGVTWHAILPLSGEGPEAARQDKVIYGVLQSAIAVLMVRLGGFRLFEAVMRVCICLMFFVVIFTALALRPDAGEIARGLLVPMIPPGGSSWTIALIGGIGGTVTVLCYGYWIREEGRTSPDDLATCRFDLLSAYVATAIFGIGMVVIGNSLGELEGGGATLVVEMAGRLEHALGRAGTLGRWLFLAGAWGAAFSSLLGVWQSVPYLFADLWRMLRRGEAHPDPVDTRSLPYRGYLYAIASVPILGLAGVNFSGMQKTYAIVGALFVPMLAVVLLVLNGRADWVGQRYKNSWLTVLVLLAALGFFAYAGVIEVSEQWAAG